MGLALLAHASMPLKYWDEAFLVATYLINRIPTKLLSYDTPLHKLLGATPDYSHFRVFGCACWPNLRPYNSHKLQLRSIRCVFLGYSNMHKGFKCLDISKGRIYISRDVIFDESVFPFASLHSTAGARYHSDVLLIPGDNAITNMDIVHTVPTLSVFDASVQLQPGDDSLCTVHVPIELPLAPDFQQQTVLDDPLPAPALQQPIAPSVPALQ